MQINIHGRFYSVPPTCAPEPELCAAFDARVRTQLEAAARAARIPQETFHVPVMTETGEHERDPKTGEPVMRAVQAWGDLPDELHAAVVVPTAEDLVPPPPAAPAPVVVPVAEEE